VLDFSQVPSTIHGEAPMTLTRNRQLSGPCVRALAEQRPIHSEEMAGVREGDVLGGKYRIGRVLGAGGMGVVVAAHHAQLDSTVAIKLLWPSMLGDREAVRRFAREARAAAKIGGEHVARVLDVGTLDGEAPYIVMEFLDGVDLARWLETHGPLAIEQAVGFVLQACIAVAEAHGLGIVHRDLKPSNLFCTRRADGQPLIKVLDFGISKITGADASRSDSQRATKKNAMIGSPFYMSPEQMKSSRDVDLRADIWALGVILFELLTHNVPFHGETLPQVCTQITLEEPPPVRNLRPDVPAGLEAVIGKCLEKSPEKRVQNIADLAQALLEFGSQDARASVAIILGIVPSVAVDLVETSFQSIKRRRSTAVTIAVVALAVASALVAWLTPRRPQSLVSFRVADGQRAQAAIPVTPHLQSQAADAVDSAAPVVAPNAASGAPSISTGRPRGTRLPSASQRANPEVLRRSERARILLDRSDPWGH
jgi:serine/threonine protein kinase